MRKIKFLEFFFFIFIAAFIAILMLLRSPSENYPKAPDFSLNGFAGEKIELNQLKNKLTVINIWSSWCKPCQQEATDIEKIWRKYKRRIHMIGINHSDKRTYALRFIKEFELTYPNAFDDKDVATDKFKITGVPETFIIKDGLIVVHIPGPTTFEYLSEKIEENL